MGKNNTSKNLNHTSNRVELEDEPKTGIRMPQGSFAIIITILCVGIALFHIWENTMGTMSDLWRNSIHLGGFGLLGFLLYPGWKKGDTNKVVLSIDVLLGVLIFSCGLYLVFFEEALHARYEVPITRDLIFAGISIILTIELVRRTSGWIIPGLAIAVLSYLLWWGRYVEGIFHFRGMNLTRVLYRMYFTDEGLFGMIANISSTFVFMFIIFAAFLLKSGGSDFIISIAQKLAGRITGGPGLVAVLASGLMGTISGSAIANTVSTGSVTIPMMKKAGFSGKFAAGVESASSTGGQLMPPIMGAGAFIMAEWTQLPFTTIIGVALLPGIMYFASVAFYVFLEARKQDLKPVNLTQDRSLGEILREGIHFIIPIMVLVGLLIYGFTPTYCAGWSIVSVIVASWLSKEHRMDIKDIIASLELGCKNMVSVALLLVATGIIVGVINMTGIAITFSQLIVDWSNSILIVALILIALASLLMGMGLPVTASYVMLAILTAPALQQMGVSLLAAHMIIFWLSQDSNVTPPVCLAAFAGAAIAKSPPMATGLVAWKLAKGLYIMPLLFAYTALIDGSLPEQLEIFAFGILGLFLFATAMTGYLIHELHFIFRVVLICVAFTLFSPLLWVKLTAVGVFGMICLFNKKQSTPSQSLVV